MNNYGSLTVHACRQPQSTVTVVEIIRLQAEQRGQRPDNVYRLPTIEQSSHFYQAKPRGVVLQSDVVTCV